MGIGLEKAYLASFYYHAPIRLPQNVDVSYAIGRQELDHNVSSLYRWCIQTK